MVATVAAPGRRSRGKGTRRRSFCRGCWRRSSGGVVRVLVGRLLLVERLILLRLYTEQRHDVGEEVWPCSGCLLGRPGEHGGQVGVDVRPGGRARAGWGL